MKGCWLALTTVILGLTGCAGTPKREMQQPQAEEFSIPPAKYDTPTDYPRNEQGFMPKGPGQPFNTSGVGQGSAPNLPGGPSSGMGGRR